MPFRELRLDDKISYGSKGGPGFNTNIIVLDGGNEERVVRWEDGKRQYDVSYGVKHPKDLHYVYAFFQNMMGCAYGFRYKDWLDYATTSSGNTHVPLSNVGTEQAVSHLDMPLGTGNGTTTVFRLKKVYTVGGYTKTRLISKPVTGTVLVGVNGSNVTTGWTVDTTTGQITFTSAPANGAVLTAGFEFDTPVRFGKDLDNPGHLSAGADDFGYGSVDAIPLVELSDLEVGPGGTDTGNSGDGLYCGAAIEICMAADYQLSAGLARAYILEPNAAGLNIFLPAEANTPAGGPVFWLINEGPNSVTLKTHTGTTLATIAVGSAAVALLATDSGNTNHWYLI